ncbi:hypothetical protein C5167_030078 [Papaver somniferum]|nr:hypothetical protein C5167_030078 [Papaver somniferum]
MTLPFSSNYIPTWSSDHIKYFNGGNEIQLNLDNFTGTWFHSKGSYLFGYFHMHIKLVAGDSAGGVANREQRIYLWLDPTEKYHTYSVLWNSYLITIFKNTENLGVKFASEQPMKLYSSLWNADDWATRGGREKTDWSKAPFVASYKGFYIDACDATLDDEFCETGKSGGIRRNTETLMQLSTGGSCGCIGNSPSTTIALIRLGSLRGL